MLFTILADITVFVHFIWIVFLIFGALLGRRHKSIKYIHIGGLVFAVILQVFDWYCPLTHLEVWLRTKQSSPEPYSGSFIVHYLEKIVYLEVTRWEIAVLTILLCLFSGWIYRSKSSA